MDATVYTEERKQELKKLVEEVAELSLRRKKFIDEYNSILNKPENFKQNVSERFEGQDEEQDDDSTKQKIKIKTKVGEREVETGTEYFLGKVIEYNEKGFEVYRVPRLTILGENEDGTIKIKDGKGDVRDVSKEVLEDYKLAKVSSTLKNKVAKYYLEHMNSVFEFYGKKKTNANGERVPVKGRLEYEQTEKGQKDKLFFVYKDEKGKIVRKEIDGSMVIPKKGYKHGILKHIGNLSPAQQKAEEDFSKTISENVQSKLQRRAALLESLYEEVLDKKENSEKLISEKTAKLESLRKQIAEITEQIETNKNPEDKRFKEFRFKEVVSQAIKKVTELSKMEQALQQELEELYSIDDDLKFNIDYLGNLIENIEELPTSTKELIAQLNDELIDLNIMVEETGKQINLVSSLLDDTRDAIKSAIKYLSSLIKNFESRYFNVPSPNGQKWVDFLQSNPNFLKIKPNYKAEFSALEEIIAETEDYQITPNEKRLEDLNEHLEILQGALKNYDKQIKVREELLEKLEDVFSKYKEQKREALELAKNEKLRKEFIGTMDTGTQPVASDSKGEKYYEVDAKKDEYSVVGGTRPVSNDRPHNIRANRFGVKFQGFTQKKKESIKGRIVTFTTEGLQRVDGLSELVVGDSPAKKEDVIALVMVRSNPDGTYSLINEFGESLTKEELKNPLDHVVFQVFPSEKLEGNYAGKKGSMFREGTPKELIDSLTKQYKEWRTNILSQEELSAPKDFKTSFGIPQYVTTLVEKQVGGKTVQVEEVNYDATTPVTETGIVTDIDLESKKLITVSTGESVTEGSSTFKTKLGRVFLTPNGGLIKLNNRKLNKKEATTIYEAILQLSKIASEKQTIKDNPEADRIVRWLKTVVYWGIAKNTQTKERKKAGYNNIWFEDFQLEDGTTTTRLFISGKGYNIDFTPFEIESKRNEIISMVAELYHNVSATSVNSDSWNNVYNEITGFDKQGNPITRTWKNYQTYLLSSQGRSESEIPLTTIVRPKRGENDVILNGVYFTLNETADTFNFEIAKPAPVVAKETKPVETKPEQKVSETKVDEKPSSQEREVNINSSFSDFTPDGKTVHKYKTSAGAVNVVINENGEPFFAYEDETGIKDEETLDTLQKLVDKTKLQPEELIHKIRIEIFSVFISAKKTAEMPADTSLTAKPVTEPATETKAEQPIFQSTSTQSEIEAKKADIERRRQEELNNVQKQRQRKSKKTLNKNKVAEVIKKLNDIINDDSKDNEFEKIEEELDDLLRLTGYTTRTNGEKGSLEIELIESNYDSYGSNIFEGTSTEVIDFAIRKVGDEIRVNTGSGVFNSTVTKIDSEGRVVEAKDDNGNIVIYNGTVLNLTQLEQVQKINAKYDAELKALEETAPITESKTETKTTEEPIVPKVETPSVNNPFSNRPKPSNPDNTAMRLAPTEMPKTFSKENFEKLEEWLKANFPNLPVYRVRNVIEASNGRQAWGMLHKGAIYLYENAEVGTAYHEVFEAVWAMFTTAQERNNITKDFRNRKGTYVDRFTGETVEYKNATDDQMREELAEEFRDYVLYDKNPKQSSPAKTPSFLKKIFDEIINFFKKFFIGENYAKNTKELFDRIGNGYYKTYIPAEQKLSFANVGYNYVDVVYPDATSTFRLDAIQNITATQIHQLMQQMTYSTITQMIGANEDLFNIETMNKKELYEIIKNDILNNRIGNLADQVRDTNPNLYESYGVLYNNIYNQWPLIEKKHEEYLMSYGITFDESDNIDYENYEKSKDEGYGDARKIDAFKKLNSTIKLLLSSLSETYIDGSVTRSKINEIGGVNLLPLGSVYVDLLNKLHASTNLNDMINRFREAARNNANYRPLFQRIFKVDAVKETPIDYNALSKSDVRIINGLWKTFKKQAPTVSALFILPNGDVVVGDSNTSGAVRENRREIINSIIGTIKEGKNPYIVKDKNKGYIPTNNLSKRQEASDLKGAIEFLRFIGIEFNEPLVKKLSDSDINRLVRASNGILRSLKERVTDKGIKIINQNTLDVSNRLLELGLLKTKMETSEFETTYFNINGERSQTFLGPNALSHFYDEINNISSLEELSDTQLAYLTTDSFVVGSSVMMDRLFNSNGDKIENDPEILKPFIIDGTFDEDYGKNTESSKLTKKQRYVQEINMNINGIYMNLVPGDASMQTAIKLHNVENPFVTKDGVADKTYLDVFRKYFISEVDVSRESNRNVTQGRDKKDLRFFKSILGKELHTKIVKASQNSTVSSESIFEKFKKEINEKVEQFINEKTDKSIDKLKQYGILMTNPEGVGYVVENILAFEKESSYSIEAVREVVKQQQLNFTIANIELHKLIYSDPYQYKDELKRIKNFSSPRQVISYGDSNLNQRYNELYNSTDAEDKLFNTEFNRDTINGATISDVISDYPELGYDAYEETDGGGIITDKGLRYLKIKNGEWTPENEEQYIYDMAYMKKTLGITLSAIEKQRLEKGNPNVQSNYTPIKPIVAGNKNMGRSYNDVVLDKFALFPISFRMIHQLNPTANMLKLYKKMVEDNVDYVVHSSGRKVGAENVYQLYNKDGSFNESPLISEEEKNNQTGKQTVFTLPLSIFAIQTEVPTKEKGQVTQGSQPTKLATMDFMQAGVPIDFMPEETDFEKRYNGWNNLLDKSSYNNGDNLYNELKNNQDLLEARIENGVSSLFKRLGIKKLQNDEYELTNPELTFKILKEELLKREVNDNIIDALSGYEDGKFVLEAIPSYQQIRNIIYSIAHKSVVAPKINGGQKVQISSAMLESQRAEAKEVTDSKGNTKLIYQSDVLNFYKDEDGKRVAEVMVARWFNSPLSDEKLLEFLNETEEGQRILSGVAFRIPTQKQNSIERIKIAKFLPRGYGDSVIVPSALVKKVGSDFDIDKLFMYLKNVYTTNDGKIKTVPYFGKGQEAREQFIKMHDSGELNEYLKSIKDGLPQGEAEDRLMESIFPEEYSAQREDVADRLYRQSLDNAYIESFEKLVSHPLNFKNLVKPNSAKQMQDLTSEIEQLLGNESIDYSDVGKMLDREFMSELRNDFVRSKYAIGIAAVSQTGNAQSQRTLLTIDKSKLNKVSPVDREWLGEAEISFANYNSVKGMPTLSKIEDANENEDFRNYISDVIGQVIDGYVDVNKDPWIMRLGVTPNVAGTWLFLIRIGVPLRDVAFFMNQPIIREYLQLLENNGKSYLFNSTMIEIAKSPYKYVATKDASFKTISSVEDLKKMIGKNESSLSPLQSANQLYILDEFLKYSKMAEHLLIFTQATNFDTATFNDPFLVFKKTLQIEKARQTIFSDVDEFLDSSFIGKLKKSIDGFRDGISEILLSDRPDNPNGESIRSVLETVLTPYAGMNDSDFISISKKAVITLFDWAVQTDRKINTQIKSVLLDSDKKDSVASRVIKLKKAAENSTHPLHNNYLLKNIQIEEGQEENQVNNLYIKAKSTKVYDQNQIIYALREIKNNLPEKDKQLYGDIVRLAVLQSGLSTSRISFTSLLPFEDFLSVYNDTLSKIDKMPNLSNFVELNVLERTNWNDPNIVATSKERVIKTRFGYFKPQTATLPKNVQINIREGKLPKTVFISNRSNDGRSEILTFVWSDMSISGAVKKEMAKRGDFSFMKKGLFKKVYGVTEEGISSPVIYQNVNKKTGVVYENYVYKMINAWGDSLYANEFYDKVNDSTNNAQMSILDNGYEKVREVSDDVMIEAFKGSLLTEEGIILEQEYEEQQSQEIEELFDPSLPKINIYAGTGENAELSNFAERPVTDALGVSFKNVEAAFQYAKTNFATGNNDDIKMKLQTSSGAQARSLGQQIKGLNVTVWDNNSSAIMKSLIKESFMDNTKALNLLLSTGNAELTHRQDNSKWGKEFPRLLMEVRKELGSTQPSVSVENVEEKIKVDNSTLKDGDVVYDKNGTKFIFRGLRQPGQTGEGSPRLERTDGSGEIAIPGIGIELFKDNLISLESKNNPLDCN